MRKMKLRKYVIFLIMFLFITANIGISAQNMDISKFKDICYQKQDELGELEEEECVVPDFLEIGDIMLMDVRGDQSRVGQIPGPHNEHAALYIGGNFFVHAGADLGFIVCVKNYSRFYKHAKNFAFLRVKTATPSQRQAAVNWAMKRQGCDYQYWDCFPWFGLKIADVNSKHPTSNRFYCFELVWAAYYNQGVDIDSTEWDPDPPYFLYPWVYGEDILADDDIEVLYSEVNDSTEIEKPRHGVYINNKKIISTYSKTIISGDVDIEVNMVDPDRIQKVNFYIDNEYKANDTTEPFNWTWKERSFGEKVIRAEAVDYMQRAFSTNITVNKYF